MIRITYQLIRYEFQLTNWILVQRIVVLRTFYLIWHIVGCISASLKLSVLIVLVIPVSAAFPCLKVILSSRYLIFTTRPHCCIVHSQHVSKTMSIRLKIIKSLFTNTRRWIIINVFVFACETRCVVKIAWNAISVRALKKKNITKRYLYLCRYSYASDS